MKNKTEKSTNKKKMKWGAQKFLLVVGVIYLIAFLLNSKLTMEALQITNQSLIKMAPIVVLVFVVMVVSNFFLTPERVKKHFGHEAGFKGWVYAIIFGILVAGPPYALYPMLKQMKEHGLKTSYLAAFLYNRNVKIPLIPAMIYYFGWQYTVVMIFLVIFFSVISGMMMEKIVTSPT